MGKFDMGAFAQSLTREVSAVPASERDIEAVTAEIIQLKQDAGNAIIGIGQRLIEAKAMLSHGDWLPWLEERVEFTDRTARNFMRLSREWTNRKTLSDLGASKALALLGLPPSERDAFIEEPHIVDGEEKRVGDMSARELKRALQERDEARKEAEAQTELQALRDRPVDVAVETVIDEAAVERAKAEALAEMESKVNKAEAARKEAETQRKAAEIALREAKKQADANAAAVSRAQKTEQELAEARRQLEAAKGAEARAVISSDADLASFNLLFSQAQVLINQMLGLLMKVQERDDETAGKLKKALIALADAVRGCAE